MLPTTAVFALEVNMLLLYISILCFCTATEDWVGSRDGARNIFIILFFFSSFFFRFIHGMYPWLIGMLTCSSSCATSAADSAGAVFY